MKFLSDLKKWESENKKPGDPAAPAPANGVKPEDRAAASQLGAQPGEQPAVDPAQPGAEPAAPPVTPQQLADMMKSVPEFGALLEQHPEIKGPLFAMGRELAAAKPVMEIFPTVGDAQFAQEHAQQLVGLKTLSMRAVDRPESVPELLGAFDSQFAVVDKEGKPVLDAGGKPTYAADRKVFQEALVGRELKGHADSFTPQIEQLKAKLASGVYPHEAAKAMDQKRLETLEYANLALQVTGQILDGSWFQEAPPEIPADATPEFKTWAEQERERLANERKAIDDQKRGASAEQRQQQRTAFQSSVRGDMGTVAGTLIGQKLKEVIDSGVYIPEFEMQRKYVDPKTGQPTKTSDIGARLFMQFENELMKPGSRTLMEITQHELLPENDQTRATRREYYQRKAADIIPRLIDAEVERIQGLVKLDKDKQAERAKARAGAAEAEPNSGGGGLPQQASEQQLRAQAEEAARKDPNYAASTPAERQARIVTAYNRLRGGGRK